MFIDEIAQVLVTAGVGVIGETLFLHSTSVIPPAGAGPYTSLIETSGGGFGRTHNGSATEFPTAQIAVRAKKPSEARAKAVEAYRALGSENGMTNAMLSGVWYLTLRPRQNVTDTGLDAQGRALYVFNIEAEKKPS